MTKCIVPVKMFLPLPVFFFFFLHLQYSDHPTNFNITHTVDNVSKYTF